MLADAVVIAADQQEPELVQGAGRFLHNLTNQPHLLIHSHQTTTWYDMLAAVVVTVDQQGCDIYKCWVPSVQPHLLVHSHQPSQSSAHQDPKEGPHIGYGMRAHVP
jgi:hypothetical protein